MLRLFKEDRVEEFREQVKSFFPDPEAHQHKIVYLEWDYRPLRISLYSVRDTKSKSIMLMFTEVLSGEEKPARLLSFMESPDNETPWSSDQTYY